MSISLVPDQEPVAAVVGDGIERWVFTEITKEMGLGVEFECEIHPLNVLTFQAYVLPSMGKEQSKKLPTLEVYNRAYAGRTHVKLRRGRGAKGWAVDEVASLEECRPRSQTARQVDGFGETVVAKPAPVEPAPIRRQRVSDPILEEQGWVLSLEDDGWHALNTIRKHRAGLGYTLAAHAEEAAANLQDAFDRKVLSERDSAQSGWVDVEESGQGSVVGGQSEDHAAAPVLSDSEADEILETAIEAVEDPVEVVELQTAEPVQTLHSSEQVAPIGEVELSIYKCFPSPTNPRKNFDQKDIDDLGKSIIENGLINAITVRVRPYYKIQPGLPFGDELTGVDVIDPYRSVDDQILYRVDTAAEAVEIVRRLDRDRGEYEIVAGERRWRAHVSKKIGVIRARVIEISDANLRGIQLEENIKRKDLTPLELAASFADAIKSGEFTAETLAKKVSVSESGIRATMKLLALPETARLALNMGSMAVSTAELIARRPNEEQRERLSQIVIAEGLSYGQVKKLIETDFSRELKGAAFELEDPDLIPAAGACTTCVYRSGNDRETYPDGRDDVCNSPSCYSAKEAAFWQLRTIAEERAMEEYTDDGKTDSAVVEESPKAANAWDEAFSDGSKTFAPDQPKERPAEPTEESQGILLASDSDELDASTGELGPLEGVARSTGESGDGEPTASFEIGDDGYDQRLRQASKEAAVAVSDLIRNEGAPRSPESQPERAATVETRSSSNPQQKAKPAPAVSSSPDGFPLQLQGVPIHITVAVFPVQNGKASRSTVISVRQDAAQLGGKVVVINATSLREVFDAAENAAIEFIPSAAPIALRTSLDKEPARASAPAKSKSTAPKRPATKAKAATAKPTAKPAARKAVASKGSSSAKAKRRK